MRRVSSSDGSLLGVDLNDDGPPMPTEGMRGIAEIMGHCSQWMRQMANPVPGLNIVLNGSNPGVERAPQKVSRLNGEELAAMGNLASGLAEVPEETGSDNPETPPETDDASPIPEGGQNAASASPSQKVEETTTPATTGDPLPQVQPTTEGSPTPVPNNVTPADHYESVLPDDDAIDVDPKMPPELQEDISTFGPIAMATDFSGFNADTPDADGE